MLVDAENTSKEGAYVTLAGDLADADAARRSPSSRRSSLWIPAGESRTFALVDRERKPRPTATRRRSSCAARRFPSSHRRRRVDQIREIEDDGKLVVQGMLAQQGPRRGTIVVIASFHGADGRPMTRPFSIAARAAANTDQSVQFVSPPGAKHGTIYVGEISY